VLRWCVGKKRKLRKLMRKRGVDDAPALAICLGKSCAPREVSRALVERARAHVAAGGAPVRIVLAGCLHVCEDGPIAATYPRIEFHRHVDGARVCELVDALDGRQGEDEVKVGAGEPQ
jgi:(2Fe-2S) ferredoxin